MSVENDKPSKQDINADWQRRRDASRSHGMELTRQQALKKLEEELAKAKKKRGKAR